MKKNWDALNNIQIDALREIGSIGAGNAATALSKLLNKKINMKVPIVRILEFKDVSKILGEEERLVVGILLKMHGDITGDIMYTLDKSAAQLLVSILMGKESKEEEFGEIELSALKEIGNILSGSYLNALSALTKMRIQLSVPQLCIDMAGAIINVPAIEYGNTGESVLYIETEFNESNDKVFGDFFVIPDMKSFASLLKALGVSAK